MGIFSKKPSEEELAAMEENKGILEQFNATAAWGVKNPRTATQFVYDENMKAFCIVGGPVDETEQWKEKNPWVVRFDQVEDVWLDVEEWWSEDDDKFEVFHRCPPLNVSRFDEVFWKYNLYMNFETTHPFCRNIRYRMNSNTNVLKIPGLRIFARRGLELSGEYRGKEIRAKRIELEEFAVKLKDSIGKEKFLDTITGDRPDSILDMIREDMTNDWYVSRVENVAKHVKRAGRISKTIRKNK